MPRLVDYRVMRNYTPLIFVLIYLRSLVKLIIMSPCFRSPTQERMRRFPHRPASANIPSPSRFWVVFFMRQSIITVYILLILSKLSAHLSYKCLDVSFRPNQADLSASVGNSQMIDADTATTATNVGLSLTCVRLVSDF